MDRLFEALVIQFRIRDGDPVERGGEDVDILADVQLVLQGRGLAADGGEIIEEGRTQEALDGIHILLESGGERADGPVQPVFPSGFIEEGRQVIINSGTPCLENRFGSRYGILYLCLRIRCIRFTNGLHHRRCDDFRVDFIQELGRINLSKQLFQLSNHGLRFLLRFFGHSGERLQERLDEILSHLILDDLQDLGRLQFQRLIHFLEQVEDLADGRHQRLYLGPEILLRIFGSDENHLSQLAEQGFQQAPERPVVRNVRVEQAEEADDLRRQVLDIVDPVHGIQILEIGDGILEHPLDTPPPERGDGERIGETGDQIDHIPGHTIDFFLEGSVHGCGHSRNLVGIVRDAKCRNIHQVQGEGVMLARDGIDGACHGVERIVDGCLDFILGGIQKPRRAREGPVQRIGGIRNKALDEGRSTFHDPVDGRANALELFDEGFGHFQFQSLLPDDAHEVQDCVNLRESGRDLFVSFHEHPVFLGFLGVLERLPELLNSVLDLLLRGIVGVRRLLDRLLEERPDHFLHLLGLFPDAFEIILYPCLYRITNILDRFTHLLIHLIRLELGIADLLGEHVLPVLEEGEEDVLENGAGEIFQVEIVIGIAKRRIQFCLDGGHLDVLEALHQRSDVFPRIEQDLEKLRIVDIPGGVGNPLQVVPQFLQQIEGLAEQIVEILQVLALGKIDTHPGEDGIDHLLEIACDRFGGNERLFETRGGSLAVGIGFLDGLPDTGEFLLDVQK